MRTFNVVLFCLLVLFVPSTSLAQWPMARRDPQRTAASTGRAQLGSPVQTWGRYLGGSVGSGQLIAVDINRDMTVDTVFITGGKLVAKRSDDSLVWETAPLGLFSIAAVEDLNGDGELDVVVVGFPGLVAVVGGRDGRIEWRTAYDTFGPSLGAVRLGDFTGDGRADVYVAEANCGSPGQRGDIAWAYTFGRGFGAGSEDETTRLWQLERGRDYVCGVNDLVADLTGDGRADVVTFSSTQAWVFDGTTGRKISSGNDSSPVFGAYPLGFSVPYGVLTVDPLDTDGDGRPEIVGYTNNSYTPSINSRAVFVLAFDPARPRGERLYVRWRVGVPTLATDTHGFVHNGAADLDRDGRSEVVSTFDVLGEGPTTYIYRGTDGVVLARLAGVAVAGVYDLGPGPLTLLTRRGADLVGYRFTSLTVPLDAGTLAPPAFTIAGAEVLNFSDLSRRRRGSAVLVQATLPEADGVHRALVLLAGARIQLWSAWGASPALRATYDLGELTPLALAPESDIERPGAGILLARSDGYLLVLDRTLNVLNFGTTEIPLPGIRLGGFYSGGCGGLSAPVAARYDRAGDSVFATDSRRALLRLDATMASRVRPPTVDWEWPGAALPVLTDADGDGTRDVLAVTDARVPGQLRTLSARRGDGVTALWSVTIPDRSSETVSGALVPLAGATGGPRFAVQTRDSGNGEGRVYGFTSRGDRAFAATPVLTAGSGQGQLTALDVDADGREDGVIYMASPLMFYSGATGALLGSGPAVHALMPVVVRGRAGPIDLIGSAAHSSVDGLVIERGTGTPAYQAVARWSLPVSVYPAGTFSSCMGAVVQCPGGLRFASARGASARLVLADATTGAVRFDSVLGGGRQWASEDEARRAATNLGVLGNVTAVRGLEGEATPAFLVGSTDGYLYAVDACSATPVVRWAMNFRAPVGEAILADTDGDGEDEIAVEVADGFLYGIDTQSFAPPSYVYDTDPPSGVSDADVDEVRGRALYASWAAVPFATGYEWALFTAGGTAVTRRAGEPGNPFILVPDGVTRVATEEGLVSGSRYFFAVRALASGGRVSPEAVSDGVRFVRAVLPLPDAGGADGAMDVTITMDTPEADVTSDLGPPRDLPSVSEGVSAPDVLDARDVVDASQASDLGAPGDVTDAGVAPRVEVSADLGADLGLVRDTGAPSVVGDAGGCGCEVPGAAGRGGRWALWLLAAALVCTRRARRRVAHR